MAHNVTIRPNNGIIHAEQWGQFITYRGKDAEIVSQLTGITLQQGSDNSEYLTHMLYQGDTYFPKMVRAGFKIMITEV